ncbi:MAG: hypothetical protein ACRDF4_03900, partial [Rhabdochlamydiaceae bacterium]
ARASSRIGRGRQKEVEGDDSEETSRLEEMNTTDDSFENNSTPAMTTSLSPVSLRELLSPREFEAKIRKGIRVHSSKIKGRTYVLQLGNRIKVLDGVGKKPTYLCVGTTAKCKDVIDEYTVLYLNLLLNEDGLLRVANVLNYDLTV